MVGRKLALALSGGGTRATAFHLGMLLRLALGNELEEVGALSTVSGGSLAVALVFAQANNRWPNSREFSEIVFPKAISVLTTKSLQGDAFVRTLSRPWMLLSSRGNLFAEAIRSCWGVHGTLKELPVQPVWLINATSFETGRNWRFSQGRIGDWRYGINEQQKVSVAQAVAASAAIPYMAGFVKLSISSENWFSIDPATDKPVAPIVPKSKMVRLWDGGVYENLGIEALYKPSRGFTLPGIETLIVSDASAHLPDAYDLASGIFMRRSPFLRAPRLYEIASEQTRALRSRMLMEAVHEKRVSASIIRMGRSCSFIEQASGLDQRLPAEAVLSNIVVENLAAFPTNGSAIPFDSCRLLVRHGFETADATLSAYQSPSFAHRIAWSDNMMLASQKDAGLS